MDKSLVSIKNLSTQKKKNVIRFLLKACKLDSIFHYKSEDYSDLKLAVESRTKTQYSWNGLMNHP